MSLFNKYINNIKSVLNGDVYELNVIDGDAYIDFLHDNITYSELLEIRKMIAER